MNDDQQAAQHADETRLQFEMVVVLTEATRRPLTQDEVMLLAWGAGVSNQLYREIRK